MGRIFVVEDDPLVRRAVARSLSGAGFAVEVCSDAEEALRRLDAGQDVVDVVLTDVFMPGKTGLELLAEAQSRWPDVAFVLMTGRATVTAAVEAMRLGAYDYLVKPADAENTLIPTMRRAVAHKRLLERNRFLEGQLAAAQRAEGLVGDSAEMRQVSTLISAAAPADVTVLVLGESGTGKELVARAIHRQSRRSGHAFVDINCAALTESLLESELFGHVKGAFTGATSSRRGLFETASGGTLFLDEVGELAQTTQARLLRVLQEGAVRPVGASESKSVDVRIIAATNRDLSKEVEAGRFRQDLFYRLNVLTVEIPPLRERPEDIPGLVAHFVGKHAERLERPRPSVEPEVLELLSEHSWPGNVRELENVIERALVLCSTDRITTALLPKQLRQSGPRLSTPGGDGALVPLNDARDEFLRRYVARALSMASGNVAEAARLAGVDPSNFRRVIKRLESGESSDS
ncbi:MAG: sigma-54-dependent Fis family transcriptional regulator [Polyangiaceae bacterium]|nr:sigma-54-dependent Fis family transcriptional regulator [Polyangiaceae bacterium]